MDVNPDTGRIPAVDVGALDIRAAGARSVGVPITGTRGQDVEPITSTRAVDVPTVNARAVDLAAVNAHSSEMAAVDAGAVGIPVVDVHPVVECGRRPHEGGVRRDLPGHGHPVRRGP